jgi:putative transposase
MISWPTGTVTSCSTLSMPTTAKDLVLKLLVATSTREARALDQIIERRGKPTAIRCYDGPEYISQVLADWAAEQGVRLEFIQPGNPQQNAYVERYNRTVRYDWLTHHLFESNEEVQERATNRLWTYNNERPNMSIGGITPKQRLAMAA